MRDRRDCGAGCDGRLRERVLDCAGRPVRKGAGDSPQAIGPECMSGRQFARTGFASAAAMRPRDMEQVR